MTEKATIAAGCFWCIEPIFTQLAGVIDTKVGYTGGHLDKPSYQAVCAGTTGHAEAIEITYNSDKISYEELLTCFWKNHDPTTLNRQGPDIGSQYRSAIFYHNDTQKQTAQELFDALTKNNVFDQPIVTEIVPANTFWLAEEYHQRYFEKRQKSSS